LPQFFSHLFFDCRKKKMPHVGTVVIVPNDVVGRVAPNDVRGWAGIVTDIVTPTHVIVTFGGGESRVWPSIHVLEWVVTVTPAGSPRAATCPCAPGIPMLEPLDYLYDNDHFAFRVKRALHLEF
jgi:hypothetical protein